MNPPPTSWQFLRVWIAIGAQSFGGGPSTLALMRRAVVEDRKWLTDEQFTRDWALCQICPGINLLGMAVLIGRTVRGAPGIALALLGLLAPSVGITLLLTATFRLAYHTQALQSAVRGAIPATVGLGWLMSFQMGRTVLTASRREGRLDVLFTVAILGLSAAIFAWVKPSPILVLLGAGALSSVYRTASHRRRIPEPAA